MKHNQEKLFSSPNETSIQPDNKISIASKQINDIIQFQEPSTSKNYSFKTEIRINILENSKESHKSLNSEGSLSLTLFNEPKKEDSQGEESFTTIENCLKEKTTNTHEFAIVNRNPEMQRVAVAVSEAPPPYESRPPPAYTNITRNRPGTYPNQISPNTDGDYNYPFARGSLSFLDLQIRDKFVRKVFLILGIQLLITALIITLVMFNEKSRKFVKTNLAMFYIMLGMFMIIYFVLLCYEATRRIFPLNFILLLLFTIVLSYICAAVTVFYSTKVVLLTTAGTSLLCITICLLSYQRWFDVTKWSFIIGIASLIFMTFSTIFLIVYIITHSPILWLIYSGITIALFSVFLLYDMQCILGGRRQELSPEEYIFAALSLYVDIIMIFLYMLHLVNACASS